MKYLSTFLFFVAVTTFYKESKTNPLKTKQNEHILWYEQAAKNWEEALPIGNGRLGAMVYGDPKNEKIQLNDDSLWPKDLGWGDPEGTPEDLREIRELLFKGENQKVDSLLVKKFSNKTVVRSHQTLGDLLINLKHNNISNYKRSLNLNKALIEVNYKVDGYVVSEKVFASAKDKTIIVSFKSKHPNGLNGTLKLNRDDDDGHPTAKSFSKDDYLVMKGEVTQRNGKFNSKPTPILKGVRFETLIKIKNSGGSINSQNNVITLKGVKELQLYIVSNSSYYNDDYELQNIKDLNHIKKFNLNQIEKRHIVDHQSLFNRVDFDIFTDNSLQNKPTDERLNNVKKGSTDLELQETLFHYGRYLLIASSRKGTLPANLQGLWNPHINAPWNSDYHLNINLQMNYWLANLTQLDELNMPLFDFVDRLIKNGKKTAKKNFGTRGSFLPHATDIWGPTWLRAPTAYWGVSFGAGGWLAQHYWHHYLFTKDLDFLKNRAFPVFKSIAYFYSDWIIEDKRDGSLISAPSTSPENRFINKKGVPVASCLGSAMDQQIIKEIFTNFLAANEILKTNDKLAATIRKQLNQLRTGFQIGSDGRILEWDREYLEFEPGHRHMSHLYGFHPGDQINFTQTPKLFNAVKKTLEYRLKNGGAGTGWSRAWLINCAARLMDSQMTQNNIELLLQKSIYPNLFDAHPPFQIDGNFGYTAGVVESLIQSHELNIIRVLPALPNNWEKGKIIGFKARDNIIVDMTWNDNTLNKLTLTSKFDIRKKIIYNKKQVTVNLKKGIPTEIKF